MEQNLPDFREKFLSLNWFADKRWITSAAAALAGVTLLIYYFQAGPKAPDFAQAETLVAKWTSVPDDNSLFQEMSKALRKVPALQKRYEPIIAQKLMEGGKGAEALQIAYRSLDPAREEIPYHSHFAETTLLIEQREYQKALERAAVLKEKMVRECDVEAFSGARLIGGSVLFAHNLLRIACLQQELDNKPGELAAWQDLEAFLRKNEKSPTSMLLVSSFHERGLDLTDYIAERKIQLTP